MSSSFTVQYLEVMRKKLFLHIGMKKAASTSIQRFLMKNADYLSQLGYLFPWHKDRIKQSALAHIFRVRPSIKTKTSWSEFHQLIDYTHCNNIVVSSESFESVQEQYVELLKRELKPYDTKIIIYIRRQDLRIESHYLQDIKSGVFTGCIKSYLMKYNYENLNYFLLLNVWSKYFGKDNLAIRVLEKAQIYNVYKDFLGILGINDLSNFQKLENDRNIKPNLDQAIALKFLNHSLSTSFGKTGEGRHRLDLICDFSRKVHIPFMNFSKNWNSQKKYKILPYENAINILERYEETNQKTAQYYLERNNRILFYEKLEKYDNEDLDINNIDKSKLIDLALYLIGITSSQFKK